MDTYAGIVFATWDHDSPSLEDYLGDARWYLDTIFNRRDGGTVAVGPIKWMEPVNWKTPVDNCSDNYHTVVTHTSSAIAYERFQGRPRSDHKALFERKHQHLFVNGHGLTVREVEDDSPRDRAGMTNENRHIFFEHHRSTMPEVEERLGHFRAHKIQLANHSLFPNGVLGFRLALPRGPRMTEFLALRTLRAGRARSGDTRHDNGQRQQQRRGGNVRAGRHRQLAERHGIGSDPHGAPVHA